MASPIVRGQNFGSTEIVNATKLQNIVDNSTFKGTDGNGVAFSASSGGDLGACVAAGGLEVHSTGQLQIKDLGITTAKIADSSSKTTGVTFAKMQHISTAKILGRISASEGDVEEAFDFKDEDDMSSNSATALASQQSIKAYIAATAVFKESFESAETSLPAAGTPITFSHGLSSIPKIAQIVLRCKTAEFNYSVGDEIVIGDYSDAGQLQSLYFNTSTIGWGHMYSGSTILIKNRTTDNYQSASSPNFVVVLKAFA